MRGLARMSFFSQSSRYFEFLIARLVLWSKMRAQEVRTLRRSGDISRNTPTNRDLDRKFLILTKIGSPRRLCEKKKKIETARSTLPLKKRNCETREILWILVFEGPFTTLKQIGWHLNLEEGLWIFTTKMIWNVFVSGQRLNSKFKLAHRKDGTYHKGFQKSFCSLTTKMS